MRYKLDFDIKPSHSKIAYGQKVVLIGSCFSDEMATKFKYFGFDYLSNPFGTLFHPNALARLVLMEEASFSESIVQSKDLYFSWYTSSLVYAKSRNELIEKIRLLQSSFLDYLKNADWLFVTFGTSIGYSKENEVVANCHKFSSSEFTKSLSSVQEMKELWQEALHKIKIINPTINVVFTVSPVRHSKDGLIENNRSKARLIELIGDLLNTNDFSLSLSYFPSYEIVIDELRDYRFYKEDGVHPSKEAIDYVFEKFKDVYMDENTSLLMQQIHKLRTENAHRFIHPDSAETKKFIQDSAEKKDLFLKQNRHVIW
jgi:lysophospholipase L1-like esterase